jgi:hypothetical protein
VLSNKKEIVKMAAYEIALNDVANGIDSSSFTTTEDTFFVTCYSGSVSIIDVTGGDNDVRVINVQSDPFNASKAAKGYTLGIGLDFKVKSTSPGTTCGVAY